MVMGMLYTSKVYVTFMSGKLYPVKAVLNKLSVFWGAKTRPSQKYYVIISKRTCAKKAKKKKKLK